MVRNWRLRSLSHSPHVKERKSVIHLWVLSAVQLSCNSSQDRNELGTQLSGSEFALCLTSMRRRGGERRGCECMGLSSPPFLLETRGWWESTGDLTCEAQTLPRHYSKAALLHLLSGEREPGTATPPMIPTLQRLGKKTESATRRLGQHIWVGYEVEAGGSRDADVGISQD